MAPITSSVATMLVSGTLSVFMTTYLNLMVTPPSVRLPESLSYRDPYPISGTPARMAGMQAAASLAAAA